MRICLECADGGHLDEMLGLLDAFTGHDFFFVTFNTKMTRHAGSITRIHYVPNFKSFIDPTRLPSVFRTVYTFGYLAWNTPKTLGILLRERPDVVISTGGPVTIPIFFLSRILGIRSIYVESITRVDDLSGTGRMVYPIVDIFLVQWPTLLKKYRKAEFWGRII